MIKSMTGFGITSVGDGEVTISVEVKSLNSKFFDLSVRLPKLFSEFELEWRNLVAEKLERGKISLSVDYQKTGKVEVRQNYNKQLFMAYYNELKKMADSVVAPSYDSLFQIALSSPDVIQTNGKEIIAPEEKEKVVRLILEAIEKCDHYRQEEGKILEEKLMGYIDNIGSSLREIEKLDPLRIEKMRNKLKTDITGFFGAEGFDKNRLEQEIIFYIEKLDIHEERVRLQSHLDYFQKILIEKKSNGKKLGFISQEIGREINTIGSKANDAEIQKWVVLMKEELEKVKEQLNNVL